MCDFLHKGPMWEFHTCVSFELLSFLIFVSKFWLSNGRKTFLKNGNFYFLINWVLIPSTQHSIRMFKSFGWGFVWVFAHYVWSMPRGSFCPKNPEIWLKKWRISMFKTIPLLSYSFHFIHEGVNRKHYPCRGEVENQLNHSDFSIQILIIQSIQNFSYYWFIYMFKIIGPHRQRFDFCHEGLSRKPSFCAAWLIKKLFLCSSESNFCFAEKCKKATKKQSISAFITIFLRYHSFDFSIKLSTKVITL